MAGWQIFGTLAAGNQPLSLFDTLSGQIAQTVIVPTTATGTNAIALALNANAPTINAYNNFQQFSFVAANNSTAAVTVNVNSIGAVNLYKPGNVAAGSGDITSGLLYQIAFNQALNGGLGGFVIMSATPASLSLPVTVPNGGTGVTSFATPWGVICAGTTTGGALQVVAALGASGTVLTSQGAGALPQFLATSAGAGSLVSIQTFSTSQTITIPATATKLWVRLVGGGAGATTAAAANTGGAGAGGYLEKYLTGLTAGNTLALTVGAAGAGGGHNGGTSTLASGTQTISTLTCNGGTTTPTGGTATGGDINITGGSGSNAIFITSGCVSTQTGPALGGDNPLSAMTTSSAGVGFGGGGSNGSAGAAGGMIAFWFT